MSSLEGKRDQLLARLRSYGSCAVAMSAGVDSTVVAKAAQLALGERAIAVTASSASLASGELQQAQQLAALIGIRHEVIETAEMASEAYRRNAADRCYHCKTELYTQLEGVAERLGVSVMVNGANADDTADFRPGMAAARQHNVRSPLAECGIGKSEVRQLAALWGLPIWNKPAAPCLASRIAYGQSVTPQRLAMIDAAEQYLRELGLEPVRVRYHQGDLARVEVPAAFVAQFCEPEPRRQLVTRLKQLGFKFVTLDLEGFRSGNLNNLVPVETLRRFSK